MRQLAFLLLLLLLPSPGMADSKSELHHEGVLHAGRYVVYQCTANYFTNNGNPLLPARRAGIVMMKNLAAVGHRAKVTIHYNVGLTMAVVAMDYSYRRLDGERKSEHYGPAYADLVPGFRGEIEARASVLFGHVAGCESRVEQSKRPYTFTKMGLQVPSEFTSVKMEGSFPFQLRLTRKAGSVSGVTTNWLEDYYGYCVGNSVRERDFKEQARFGVAEEETKGGLDPLQVNLDGASLAGVQAFLRERFHQLSPDELRAALGVSLSALVAREAVKSVPALKLAADRAYTSVLTRLSTSPATSALAESLSWRTATSLGLRVASRALSSVVAVLAATLDVSASSPENPEWGGPGYFLTERGTRRLITGDEADLRRATDQEPLVPAHLRELARVLQRQAKRE